MVARTRVKARVLDFTNEKGRGEFNPRQVEEGDYAGKIVSLKEQETKEKPGEPGSGGEPMWVFGFQLKDMPSAVYPYYCVLREGQLWKVRNISIACGKAIGGKLKLDPNGFVGKEVALSMITEIGTPPYKDKSAVDNVFPLKDLYGDAEDDADQDDEADDVEDDDEPEPPKRTTRRKAAPKPEPEDDDDEEDEEEPPPPPKRRTRKPAPPVEEDDDEEDEPEPPKRRTRAAAAKPPARRRAAPVVEDDDDEEEDEAPPARRRPAAKAATRRKAAPPEDDDDDDMDVEEI